MAVSWIFLRFEIHRCSVRTTHGKEKRQGQHAVGLPQSHFYTPRSLPYDNYPHRAQLHSGCTISMKRRNHEGTQST